MGTAVFFGMLIATAMGVFLIPGNFAFVEGLGRGRTKGARVEVAAPVVPAHGQAHS
jgi:hypothetical protein